MGINPTPARHLSPSFAYLYGTCLHGEFAVVSRERAESCLLLGFRNETRVAEGIGVSFGLHLDRECRVGSACAALLPAASLLAQTRGPWLSLAQVPQLPKEGCVQQLQGGPGEGEASCWFLGQARVSSGGSARTWARGQQEACSSVSQGSSP